MGFHIWEDSRREKYTDKLEIHVLELPKLNRYPSPETELLKWARFFQGEKKEEFEEMANENEYLKRAYERLVNISADEQKRREYQAREDAIRDYNWQLKTYHRRGVQEGRQEEREQSIRILITTLQEMELSREKIKEKVMGVYELEADKAEEYMKCFCG